MNKFWTLFCLFIMIVSTFIEVPSDYTLYIKWLKSGAGVFVLILVIRYLWTQITSRKILQWKWLDKTFPLKELRKSDTQYRKYFYGMKGSIAIMVIFYIIMVSVLTWVMFFFRSREQFFFDLATAIIISWIVMVIIYYIWAIFFYNVNMGWEEEDWNNLKKKKDLGEAGPEDEPTVNPHATETLGLPPGTVRGTIAVSLLVTGMAMVIASFQLDQTYDSNSLFVDNFEFFKTAFLMMIAFYFGDKSLKAITERNQGVYQQSGNSAKSSTSQGVGTGINDSPIPSNVVNPSIQSPPLTSDVSTLKNTIKGSIDETKDNGDTSSFDDKDSVG